MYIEIRSLKGIRNAAEALRDGDFDGDGRSMSVHLYIRFNRNLFLDAAEVEEVYEDDLVKMMEAVGQAQRLITLTMRTSSYGFKSDCHLPVKAVMGAIEQAEHLRTLRIENVCLFGEERDFERLSGALQRLRHLEDISFECSCRFKGSADKTIVSPLDCVVRGLGAIPSLEDVRFVQGKESGDLTPSAVGALCQLPNLEQLELLTFPPSAEALGEMASHLNANKGTKLETLSLGGNPLTSAGCKRLGEILSIKHSKIEKLHLNARSISGDARLVLVALGKALQGALCKSLRLDAPEEHLSVAVDCVKTMLRLNYRLKEVKGRQMISTRD